MKELFNLVRGKMACSLNNFLKSGPAPRLQAFQHRVPEVMDKDRPQRIQKYQYCLTIGQTVVSG
jgi:hypothetical protein